MLWAIGGFMLGVFVIYPLSVLAWMRLYEFRRDWIERRLPGQENYGRLPRHMPSHYRMWSGEEK